MAESKIFIEVIYALPEEQKLLSLSVDSGTKVQQAIEKSGILSLYPQINLQESKVGIFSKTVPLDAELREGDRIEIYRPLIIDPKQARKNKVASKK